MNLNLLTINRVSSAAISPYRFVKGTATDGVVTQASSSKDDIVGCSGQVGADAANERLDINHSGAAPIEFGGAIAFGDALTSDANGKAVKAKDGDRVGGFALENGVDGVIGSMLLAPAKADSALSDQGDLEFVANDAAPAVLRHDATYSIPPTGGASTVTLPAGAPDGTRVHFVADGTDNAHTVQYRDATGPTNITAALTAAKRHLVTAVKVGGKWVATSGVSP